MTNPHDEARTLMEKLAQIRPKALTPEQLRRRERINARNDQIQAVLIDKRVLKSPSNGKTL